MAKKKKKFKFKFGIKLRPKKIMKVKKVMIEPKEKKLTLKQVGEILRRRRERRHMRWTKKNFLREIWVL